MGDTCESSAFAQVSDAETRGTAIAPVPNRRPRKGWRRPGRRREPQPGMTPDLLGARSGQGRQGGVSTATREQKTDRSSLGEVAAQRRASRPRAHVDAISGHVRGFSESWPGRTAGMHSRTAPGEQRAPAPHGSTPSSNAEISVLTGREGRDWDPSLDKGMRRSRPSPQHAG